MKTQRNMAMPKGYEYLSGYLSQAQEHVFLINQEIEKLDGNPVNERKLVNLQDEKQSIVGNIKNEFEMQTWKDGPAKFEELEQVIDHKFSDATYKEAKAELINSGKAYNTSTYWQDKLERNLEYYKQLDKEIKQIDREERFETARINNYSDWQYESYGKDYNYNQFDDREIDLERD